MAEELTQEAFLATFRHWERVGRLDNPGAWVRRVVANRSVSTFRRGAAEAKALLRLNSHAPRAAATEPDDGMDVWREVRRLPRRQAQVVANELAAYDPVGDEWRMLPGPALDVDRGVLRWSGTDLYAVGAKTNVYPGRVPLVLAQLDRAAASWHSLPEVGLWTETYNIGARPELTAWTGGLLVAWTDSGSDGRTVAFNATAGEWMDIAPAPLHGCEAAPEPLILEQRVLAFDWCGADAIYDPATDVWTIARIDGTGTDRYAVWTGTEVLTWGDPCCYGTGGAPFTVRAWRYTPPDAD